MHYPGHLREAFCDWLDEGCPPLARVEVNYGPQTWAADRLLRRMLRCSDVLPGSLYRIPDHPCPLAVVTARAGLR
jgi:hypothetical protein